MNFFARGLTIYRHGVQRLNGWRTARSEAQDKEWNFNDVAVDLDNRAGELSRQHNPKNLGNDQIVYAISRLVRALGNANENAGTATVLIIWLTILNLGLVGVQVYFQIKPMFDERSRNNIAWQKRCSQYMDQMVSLIDGREIPCREAFPDLQK